MATTMQFHYSEEEEELLAIMKKEGEHMVKNKGAPPDLDGKESFVSATRSEASNVSSAVNTIKSARSIVSLESSKRDVVSTKINNNDKTSKSEPVWRRRLLRLGKAKEILKRSKPISTQTNIRITQPVPFAPEKKPSQPPSPKSPSMVIPPSPQEVKPASKSSSTVLANREKDEPENSDSIPDKLETKKVGKGDRGVNMEKDDSGNLAVNIDLMSRSSTMSQKSTASSIPGSKSPASQTESTTPSIETRRSVNLSRQSSTAASSLSRQQSRHELSKVNSGWKVPYSLPTRKENVNGKNPPLEEEEQSLNTEDEIYAKEDKKQPEERVIDVDDDDDGNSVSDDWSRVATVQKDNKDMTRKRGKGEPSSSCAPKRKNRMSRSRKNSGGGPKKELDPNVSTLSVKSMESNVPRRNLPMTTSIRPTDTSLGSLEDVLSVETATSTIHTHSTHGTSSTEQTATTTDEVTTDGEHTLDTALTEMSQLSLIKDDEEEEEEEGGGSDSESEDDDEEEDHDACTNVFAEDFMLIHKLLMSCRTNVACSPLGGTKLPLAATRP